MFVQKMGRSMILLHLLVFFLHVPITIVARGILPSHTRSSEVKHFESELDTNIGYWSPSTSSIDWCERNYAITQYIAEFWNCISSFSMCLLGGILFVRGLYNKIENRFLWSSLGLAFVGLGSAYFHGTLTHFGQMADELPMVYSMIIWWFVVFRMNNFTPIKHTLLGIDLSILFGIFYALLWTYVHSLQTFVLIFQAHMSLMVLGGIFILIHLYRQSNYRMNLLKYMLIIYVSVLILAFVCWVIDQQLCERMNSVGAFNPQLHAWWHVFGAVHCHLGLVCAEAMRFLALKQRIFQSDHSQSTEQPFKADEHLHVIFYLGLPYIDYSKEKATHNRKTL